MTGSSSTAVDSSLGLGRLALPMVKTCVMGVTPRTVPHTESWPG
jgi:hypothetical protein